MKKTAGFAVPLVVVTVLFVLAVAGFILAPKITSLKTKNSYNNNHAAISTAPTYKLPILETLPSPTNPPKVIKSDSKFAYWEDLYPESYYRDKYYKVDTKSVDNTPGYLIISAIYSNDKSKIALMEVPNYMVRPESEWLTKEPKYKISIVDVKSKKTTQLYESSNIMYAYFPMFWSKSDTYLVAAHDVLYQALGGGHGGDCNSIFWKIDVSDGSIHELAGPYDSQFTSDHLYVVYYANNPDFEKRCPNMCGDSNDGRLVRKNIETEVIKDLVREKYKSYSNLSIDGKFINYEWTDYFKTTDPIYNPDCLLTNQKSQGSYKVSIY